MYLFRKYFWKWDKLSNLMKLTSSFSNTGSASIRYIIYLHMCHMISCTHEKLKGCCSAKRSPWTCRSRCCWQPGSCPRTVRNSAHSRIIILNVSARGAAHPRAVILESVAVVLNNQVAVIKRVYTRLTGRQGRAGGTIHLNEKHLQSIYCRSSAWRYM